MVRYRFTGLNMRAAYEASAEFASGDADRRIQILAAGGETIRPAVTFDREPARAGFVRIPSSAYGGGGVNIEGRRQEGKTAILTQLWLREVAGEFSPEPVNVTVPAAFGLAKNYPNPFNPSTTIRFGIPSDGPVSLKAHDIVGQEVATLVDGILSAGIHDAQFDAGRGGIPLSSGVYFYKNDGRRVHRDHEIVAPEIGPMSWGLDGSTPVQGAVEFVPFLC